MFKKITLLSFFTSSLLASNLSEHFSNFLTQLGKKGDFVVKTNKIMCNTQYGTCTLKEGTILIRQSALLPTPTTIPSKYTLTFKSLKVSDVSNLIKAFKNKNSNTLLSAKLNFIDLTFEGIKIDQFIFDPKRYINTEFITEQEYKVANEMFPLTSNLEFGINQKSDQLKGVKTELSLSFTSNDFELSTFGKTWSSKPIFDSTKDFINSLEIEKIQLFARAPQKYFQYVLFLDYLENAREAKSKNSLHIFHSKYLLPERKLPMQFEDFVKNSPAYYSLRKNSSYFSKKIKSDPGIMTLFSQLKYKIDDLLIGADDSFYISLEAVDEDSTQSFIKTLSNSRVEADSEYKISDFFEIKVK